MKNNILILMILSLSILYGQTKFKTIPNLKIKTISGKTIKINNLLEESPVLINFWATWCAPCKKEMRHLKRLKKQYSNLTILAVNVDKTRSMSQVKSYIKSNRYDFIIGLDPNSLLMEKLNVKVVPTNLLVNQDREIVWQHQGYLPGDEIIMEEEIKKVMNLKRDK